ncbi:MAG: hypothetical protein JXR53_11970 [Bacteroidales bacterium]|nr:hypothetical protein [Bacteroidales bacterium]
METIFPQDIKIALAEYPFEEKIESFLADQDKYKKFQSSGISGKDYLNMIDAQIKEFYFLQDSATGAIIDPVYKIEWQYSTPCYALSIALLTRAGHLNDIKLLNSGVKALDWSINAMYNNSTAQNHGEFYIQPVLLAMNMYKDYVPGLTMKTWREKILSIDPYILYKDNLRRKKSCYNHNVVALAGEFLRMKEGLCRDPEFFEKHLEHHKQYMSEYGMYIDNPTNPPIIYDEFTRQFLTTILAEGYNGNYYDFYAQKLLNGAWTSLFMQSPYGEVPTGGRSAQHIWNEASAMVTYEIYATQYAAIGKFKEAGAFKRAAHLSFKSIMRWKRPDGTGFIVKNRFPIEAMHGYESYSAQSQYNLLACWLVAIAYLYSDDSITELPAPAEVGGFVIPIHDVFHKVFANAAGNYIEYELSGDPRYNATGLIRIHLKGSNPQLGPSDAIPRIWDNKMKKDLGGELYSVGPAWFDTTNIEHRLAEYTNISYPGPSLFSAYKSSILPEINLRLIYQKPEKVKFEIIYKGEFSGVQRISQKISITKKDIIIEDFLSGKLNSMRVYYPMLIDDGLEKTRVEIKKTGLYLHARDGRIWFRILSPNNCNIERSGKVYSYRNGFAEPAFFNVKGHRAKYKISIK